MDSISTFKINFKGTHCTKCSSFDLCRSMFFIVVSHGEVPIIENSAAVVGIEHNI